MKSFCPFCEKEYDNLEIQTKYEITTLNGVTAEWQKKYIFCPECGEELYNAELHDSNLRTVYAACKVTDWYKPVGDMCDYVNKLRNRIKELEHKLKNSVELLCPRFSEIYTDDGKQYTFCDFKSAGYDDLIMECCNKSTGEIVELYESDYLIKWFKCKSELECYYSAMRDKSSPSDCSENNSCCEEATHN